jgi:hypothetical protein
MVSMADIRRKTRPGELCLSHSEPTFAVHRFMSTTVFGAAAMPAGGSAS